MPASEMVYLSGGAFRMGSDRDYPEEASVRTAEVGPFFIDRFAVTNADFARFVLETGHVTQAELSPLAEEYPGAAPDLLHPGSAVFIMPKPGTRLRGPHDWWTFALGADWRHPEGPASNIDSRMDHPVVHIAFNDATAYARWQGKALPSEAEWEYAARGGLDGATFAWGNDLMPDGQQMANYWSGKFPFEDRRHIGPIRTEGVGSFPPNGYGLYDMIGNVWEWTTTYYTTGAGCGCAEASKSQLAPRVVKGGSFLCAESYCRRYRPAARIPQDPKTSTSHIGFRCIRKD